jgi:IS6 family transposase
MSNRPVRKLQFNNRVALSASIHPAYATIKGIETLRALRKGQAESWYYGHPQGEVRLVNRVFGL